MDATKQDIINGLKEAMKTESDGHYFYIMAAQHIKDLKGRKVFETLAKEELDHLNFLNIQYRSFMASGKPDENATLGLRAELDENDPVFSGNIRKRIAEAHFEMSALSIGIQLEIKSERHYRQQAEATLDPKVKAFYQELAEWESTHYHALLRQQDTLKEDYWTAVDFAPF